MTTSTPIDKIARRLAEVCSLATACMVGLALLSWSRDHWQLWVFGSGYVPMAPSTALALLLLNGDILARIRRPNHPATVRYGLLATIAVAFFAWLVLVQRSAGFELPVEQWLSGTTDTIGGIPVGRMSPLTAGVFLLAAGALLCGQPPFRGRRLFNYARHALALLVLLTGMVFVLGYAAGTPLWYGGTTIPMALLTAVSFLLTGLGLLAEGLGPDLQRWQDEGWLLPVARASRRPAQAGQSSAVAPLAVIVLRLAPRQFLYPLIQSWPTPSRTAETVLVRREGDDMVFLNELRHRPNTALNLRFSASQPELPAAIVARGQEGVAEGRDYRGVPVLTAFRPVPDSPWFLGAKVDQAEIYRPLRRQAVAVGSVVAVLLVAVALGLGLVSRQRDTALLSRELASERERKALAERFAHLMQNANDVILLADGDWRILEVNERTLQTYGYSLSELQQMHMPDLRPPAARAEFARQVEHLESHGGTVFETMHQRKDGSVFPVEVSARLVEIGGVRNKLAILRDTTERKRYESRLQQLIEVIQKLAAARDLGSIMAAVRSAARHLTGADGATFVLRDGDQCFYADEDAISPLWKGQRFPMSACISGWVMLNRQPAVIPDIYTDPRIPVAAYRPTFVKSLAMVPIRSADPVGAIGNYWARTCTPAPGEIQLLQTLADAAAISLENFGLYSELEQRVQQRTAELATANQELESFAYSVSHDLRAPLRHIDGFCDLLQKHLGDRLDERGRRYVGTVSDAAKRMGMLIDDLLSFSRTARTEMRQMPVHLDELIQEVIHSLQPESAGRNVEWQNGVLPVVQADRALLRQVFVNLLSNALKYTRPRDPARIEIGWREDEKLGTVVFVRDNGVGFDPAYAHKLFGVFQRLHRSDEFEGTGIGLANVHRIIQRHGGRTWAEGRPGEGATFYFSLAGRME